MPGDGSVEREARRKARLKKARKKEKEFSFTPSVRFLAGLFSLLSWPLAWLPPTMGLALGSFLGRVAFRLLSARRQVAVENIAMIREAGGLDAALDPVVTARDSFSNLGRSGWEALRLYHRGITPFLPCCSIESGAEYLAAALENARKSGRGLMFVTGHIGNWELLCQYVAGQYGFKLAIVGRSLGSPLANLLAAELRTGQGNDFIYKTGGAKEMLAVLRAGGVLGTLIDQAAVVNHEGILAPFMGREAMTNAGPLRLAQRGGAQVLMALFRRDGARHYVTILPPLTLPPKGEYTDEALLADIIKLNADLGDFIRLYPDQWLWGHKRWKFPRRASHRR